MKKYFFITILILLLTAAAFSQHDEYLLGTVQSTKGTIKVHYMKSTIGKTDYIRLAIPDKKIYTNFYIPQELKQFRQFMDKFAEWHKTATDNNHWELNKTIGNLELFRVEFATVNKKYEMRLINSKSGAQITSFSLAQVQALKETITDEKIDYVLNEEKRRKQKEDALFK